MSSSISEPGVKRTAYLIVAHQQPNHLARLVRTLDGDGCSFYIHIDAKTDEAIFRKLLPEKTNVAYSRQRYVVNWGGFSATRAILALLSSAMDDAAAYRFCLLSGSDFPIKNNRDIQAEFQSSTEFISVDRKIVFSGDAVHDRFVNRYWFHDSPLPLLRKLSGRYRRRAYKGMPLYHGSTWWALTRDCVEYIMTFLVANKTYSRFFKCVHVPDEIFVHSIIKNSTFASRISHDFEAADESSRSFASNELGCHYIDWSIGGSHPKILNLSDFQKLVDSKALFGRKFEEFRSADLLSRLEMWRYSQAAIATPSFPGNIQ